MGFLMVQVVSALVSFVFTIWCIAIDNQHSKWYKYEEFYFAVMNSSVLTFCISVALFAQRYNETFENKIQPALVACLLWIYPVLATHIIPILVLYAWIPIGVYAVWAVYFYFSKKYANFNLNYRGANCSQFSPTDAVWLCHHPL